MTTYPLLIKEETSKSSYKDHDQLYKQLLNTFFKEFLEAFFPAVHEHINFQRIKPLSEEVYTNLVQGKTRKLDIVIETTLKDTEVVVIVHVEPQSYEQKDFHERMYHYYSLLYNKYQKPIIPIAVFSYEENWDQNTFSIAFPFLHVLTFNYLTLHLKKQNWRNYIRSDNPVAAALMSEMDFKEEERVQVKKEFLRMITRMKLNPAKERLIYGFFESYLKLTPVEEEKLMEEIKNLPEADKILEIPISYEEKGKEIGREIGREMGREEGEVIGVKKVAVEMLNKGLDINFIAEVTHLTTEEIHELKKER